MRRTAGKIRKKNSHESLEIKRNPQRWKALFLPSASGMKKIIYSCREILTVKFHIVSPKKKIILACN
jgi:hypothetical protein